MYYIIDVYKRNRNNEPLTPEERAVVKFIESLIMTGILAGFYSAMPLLTQSGPINITQTCVAFMMAFALSISRSLVKLLNASSDPQVQAVGSILSHELDDVEARYAKANDVKSVDLQQTMAQPQVQPA